MTEKQDKSPQLNPSSKRSKKQSSPSEMEQVSISGQDSNAETESGSGSTKKFSLKREPNTSIKLTFEPNTITIHTMSDPPSSSETSSNITSQDFFPAEMVN